MSAQENVPCEKSEVAVVGAGLVGSLLAVFLAKRGFSVDLFERRPDMRKETIAAGRSINLAISTRGITALEAAGMDRSVLAQAVQCKGRLIHPKVADGKIGELVLQPYGKDDSECINSISRATLNKLLMDRAEETGKVKIHFKQKCTAMDFAKGELTFEDESKGHHSGAFYQCRADIVIGTDGSASCIREEMVKHPGYVSNTSRLDYGYKELVIPPTRDGGFAMEKNALHIWPRGTFMLMALPNFEGSYTCTLFLPFKGDVSFEKLTDKAAVQAFFEREFADAVPLIEDLTEAFFENPTGHMDTIKCGPWNFGGSTLLLGDAAHAIVPFFGQGANCGFEDLTELDRCFDQVGGSDLEKLFSELVKRRKNNCDAIADMAVENFIEMRDKVGDPRFLMGKAIEKILEKSFPGEYRSRYSLVTFSNAPYTVAQAVGNASDEILATLTQGIEKPEQVDMELAHKLVNEKITPLLRAAGLSDLQPVK